MNRSDTHHERSRFLTIVAIVLGVSLAIARVTFEQHLRDSEIAIPGATAAPQPAGAAAGLVLDLCMALPALLVLIRAAIDREYLLRRSRSTLIFIALGIWAVISTAWSTDRFAAMVNSSHLLAAGALLWAMVQLVRSWVDVRLIAAACFGIMLIYVAKGAIYRFVDFPANVEFWQQNKAQELAKRGWEPGSFQARQFEHKLMSGELFGFSESPNTFSALMVMFAIVSAGVAIQRIIDKDEYGWALMIGVGVVGGLALLPFAGSKAAAATPPLAAVLLVSVPYLSRRRRGAYLVGVAVIVGGTILAVLHGLYHGSLVIDSLTFRWRYWIGATRLFISHPWLGTGWANFGESYLRFRLPIASEEIKDPHNFVIRAFVELGVLGGLLMLAWQARFWWEATLPGAPSRKSILRRPLPLIVIVASTAIVINVLASVDFTFTSADRGWFIFLELLTRIFYLAILGLGMSMVLIRSSTEVELDDRPAPWVLCSITVAIGMFLIHNLIDFSLFEPGPLCLVATLCGAVLGARHQSDEKTLSLKAARGMLVASTVTWLFAAIMLGSTVAAEVIAHQSDDLVRAGNVNAAIKGFRSAFDTAPISNGDYFFRAAIALQQVSADPAQVREMFDLAIHADPLQPRYQRLKAAFELRQPSPDVARTTIAFEQAIFIDPNNVQFHVDFGNALLRFGDRYRAIEELQTAIAHNALLEAEDPKRLSPAQIEQIERAITTS